MKAIFVFLVIIVLGAVAQMFLPWWIIAVVCFLMGLAFVDKASEALISGFLAVFVLWLAVAIYKSIDNDFILLDRMSALLPIHNSWAILFVSAFIGGLVGMLSTLSGYYLQTIRQKPKRKFN